MHGKRALVKEIHYGANASHSFLRIDFAEDAARLEGLEIHVETAGKNGEPERKLKIAIKSGAASVEGAGGQAAFKEVMEISFPSANQAARARLSFWQDGLPIEAIPPQDYLQISAPAGWNA
jgi:hypothetical protein